MKGRENMNKEFLVPTGNIIKEYLEANGIKQNDLSKRMGISEKHVSNVLSGKSRLTEEFALKLEKILTTVPASYWLNYEVKYREYLARNEEIISIGNWDLKEISKKFRFGEIFKNLNLSLEEQAIEMLKILKISDFNSFETVYNNLQVDFMEDGGEKEAIVIWLNLCMDEVKIQNDNISEIKFSESEIKKSLKKFKMLSNNSNTDLSISSCRKLCNKLGVYLVICQAITNSKVRGALTTYEEYPTIFLSGRFKSHSHIWFAFMHELGHLLLHYSKNDTIISFEEDSRTTNNREEEANEFARNIFINPEAYRTFISKEKYTADTIREFAKQQGILPAFLVARLQHDNRIGYEQFVHLK